MRISVDYDKLGGSDENTQEFVIYLTNFVRKALEAAKIPINADLTDLIAKFQAACGAQLADLMKIVNSADSSYQLSQLL